MDTVMSTPAGWYNDETNGVQRYWDGNAWTEHTAPLATSPSTTPAAATKSKTPLIAFGALVVVALVAGISLVVLNRGDQGDKSAAATPEGAVESFFAALGEENLDDMAAAVAPSERSSYIDPIYETIDELKRLGIVAQSFSTSKIEGLDFTVTDLTMVSTPVTDEIVNVVASGVIKADANPLALPLGPNLLKLVTLEDLAEGMQETNEPQPFDDLALTAIKEDGRWYLSPMHSVMEAMRAEASLPSPDPSQALVPVGASSPEAAIESLINTALAFDLGGVLAHLDPNEMSALQLYAPLFLGEIEAELNSMLAETQFEMSVTDLQLDVNSSGDTASVIIKAISVEGVLDGAPVSLTLEGECMSYEVMGESDRICSDDLANMPEFGEFGEFGGLAGGFNMDSLPQTGIVVSKVDGLWYLSPVQTMTKALIAQLATLDAGDVSELFDALADGSIEDLLNGSVGGSFGMFAPGMFARQEAATIGYS